MGKEPLSKSSVDELFKKAEVEMIKVGGKMYAILPASSLQLFFKAGVDALGEAVSEKTKK